MRGTKTKKAIRFCFLKSPVGYYHVLNCELQTQAVVLKQEQKKKQMVSFYILRNFSEYKRMFPSPQLAFPMQMIRFLSF